MQRSHFGAGYSQSFLIDFNFSVFLGSCWIKRAGFSRQRMPTPPPEPNLFPLVQPYPQSFQFCIHADNIYF